MVTNLIIRLGEIYRMSTAYILRCRYHVEMSRSYVVREHIRKYEYQNEERSERQTEGSRVVWNRSECPSNVYNIAQL